MCGEGAAVQEEQARGGQGDSCGRARGQDPAPKVAASAAIPIVAVKVAPRTDDHDPRSRTPAPSGRSVNTNGTTNAGKVSLQVRIIVLKDFRR